ncbi:MAG: hypothetical protein BWX92_01000 [Deltaproteobacteria bacterium ADurb.Bin135]|nr:MAG: hypothetical protein BWX92_01000 [Deltaproteobacteria bacterium ADurb.Bin135]
MSNQIFSKIDGAIATLIGYIETGDLALPDLQRPFVWGNNRVRDLFDSMYRGYPIGYFLLWKNNTGEKLTPIGIDDKIHKVPYLLIIDGQQRLTALYSIIKKKEVKDKDYRLRRIKIAFNPVLEEFRVADAATVKNKEFINDISELFASSTWPFITNYLAQYRVYIGEIKDKYKEIIGKIQAGIDLKDAEYIFCITRLNQIKDPTDNFTQLIASLRERKAISLPENQKELFVSFFEKPIEINEDEISTRINKLHSLTNYPYQALEVSSDVGEEVVAEIFTRINSKGVSLNQADFILTLISVFWEEGRMQINDFCKSAKIVPNSATKDSPFNYIMQPDAQDIVRIIIGLGFKRSRMKDAYAILKGRDPDTNKYSTVLREKQFDVFKATLSDVINTSNWHSLIKIIQSIGYKSSGLIASGNSIINSYIFYLIGKLNYKIDYKELDMLIARWFFMSSLTSRYSGSSESIMESDLNKIKSCKDGEEFKFVINNILDSTLTNDFWDISLPNDILVTSNTISPVANAFFASLIYNGRKALFSDRKVSDLYDPSIKIKKNSLDKHHIFPKEYLKKQGIELTQINQIANLTYLEYIDNIKISDSEPKSYYTEIKSKYYSNKELILENALKEHGIPEDFYEMEYSVFLTERRKKIAMLIKEMYSNI